MRILITGGTGFVGPYLVALLKSRAAHIAVVASQHPAASDGEIEYLQAEIRDEERVRSVIRQVHPDQIYHLAGISSLDFACKNPRLAYEVNVLGAHNLFEAAMELDCAPVVLNVSTSQVYAPGPDSLSEGCAVRPENPYAVSKAMAELLVYQYRERAVGGIITARAFNHTGGGQPPHFVLPSIAKQFAAIELGLQPPKLRVGNVHVHRDFTDVRDVVRAYCALLERGRNNEIYNVCSGNAVVLTKIIEMFQSISGIKVRLEVDPEKVRPDEPSKICGDPTKIQSETGWTPQIPLESTVRDLFEYWRSQCQVRSSASTAFCNHH